MKGLSCGLASGPALNLWGPRTGQTRGLSREIQATGEGPESWGGTRPQGPGPSQGRVLEKALGCAEDVRGTQAMWAGVRAQLDPAASGQGAWPSSQEFCTYLRPPAVGHLQQKPSQHPGLASPGAGTAEGLWPETTVDSAGTLAWEGQWRRSVSCSHLHVQRQRLPWFHCLQSACSLPYGTHTVAPTSPASALPLAGSPS